MNISLKRYFPSWIANLNSNYIREETTEPMAKKYENVEKILGLLDDEQLGGLQKRLSSTERSLSDILKKLSALENEKAEREASELAAKAEEEARVAAEEAAKAAEPHRYHRRYPHH